MTICFAVGIRRAGEAHPIIVLDLAARRAVDKLTREKMLALRAEGPARKEEIV